MLLTLTFAAGYIDALSYLGLGRVFTANMTGNTVLLGIALAEFDVAAIRRSAIALTGFVAGAVAGAWIVERDDSASRWPRAVTLALILESLLLIVFAAIWYWAQEPLKSATVTAALILLSAVAMGVQSAAIRRLEIVGIATTYLTGTLTNLVSFLMGRSIRKRKPPGHTALLAGVWVAYVGGAIAAAVDLPRNLVVTLVLPVVLIITVVVISATVFRSRKE